MTKLVACFFLCFGALAFPSGASKADTDYYWKDYFDGEVPSDAIPGGRDLNGNATYIGGVIHPKGKGFLPANLYPGSFAIAHAGIEGLDNEVHIHTKYIKVLCSQHHRRYEWVPTDVKNIYDLNAKLVRGGQESNWELYVGRAFYKGEVKIGRVFKPNDTYSGLWLPESVDTGKFANFKNFDILVYYEPCRLCRG